MFGYCGILGFVHSVYDQRTDRGIRVLVVAVGVRGVVLVPTPPQVVAVAVVVVGAVVVFDNWAVWVYHDWRRETRRNPWRGKASICWLVVVVVPSLRVYRRK